MLERDTIMEKHTATGAPAEDEKIIDLYWARNHDAILETD